MFSSTRPRSSLPATSSGTNAQAYTLGDWGLLAVAAMAWGSSFLFISVGLESFTPGVIAVARVALGTATLVLLPHARAPIAREDYGRIALLGVVFVVIPYSLFPIAQQWIDSSVTGMINGATPIFAVAWATLLLRRLPGSRQLIGIALGSVGIVLVFVPELQSSSSNALGVLLTIVAVSCYGLAVNLVVPLQQKYGALPVMLRVQVAALIMLLPLGLLGIPASTWSWGSALAMIPLGVIGTGMAFVVMAMLAGRVGGSRASIASYFVPLVAIILGIALLGESVAALALIGVSLVLVGAWIASRREGNFGPGPSLRPTSARSG